MYHRNATSMGPASWIHREALGSSILLMSLIGDSLLVYCQDNTLYHFLVVPAMENGSYQSPPRLVQFGQINFRGIIHSPTRVRAISWILPEEHTRIPRVEKILTY
jgi:RAB6A-GEF complex partner protein 1